MSALRDLFSRQQLVSGWAELKPMFPRRTTPGVDGVSREHFSKSFDQEAEEISAAICSGNFRFHRLKPIAIPKEGDAIRLINVPTIRDRFIQRVLLKFLVSRYGIRWKLPNSFSSMQGDDEGVHATLIKISKRLDYHDFVIKADLSRYFDTIDRNLLKRKIERLVRHRSLHPLLFAVIDCEASARTPEERALFRKSRLLKGKGIRQGMPLSPVLAYLFLMDVDKTMSTNFYRYVDDLLFIGKTQSEVTQQFERYREAAETRGLKVHKLSSPKADSKTALFGARENFVFLGITVRRSESGNRFYIPPSSKERIEKQISESTALHPSDPRKQKGWVLTTSTKASNLVRNYKNAYHICDDWPAFERSLKQLQLNMCRSIAKKLRHIERQKDRELLLRVFGI